MSDLTVYKLDHQGRERWRYPGRALERRDGYVRLEATFDRDDIEMHYYTLRRGDRFVEHYYSDRWYNIIAIYDGDSDRLKGWYCDICRPARITPTTVHYEDLALDVWAAPGKEAVVMDEDEFEELGLEALERQEARAAVQKLLSLAAENALPL